MKKYFIGGFWFAGTPAQKPFVVGGWDKARLMSEGSAPAYYDTREEAEASAKNLMWWYKGLKFNVQEA